MREEYITQSTQSTQRNTNFEFSLCPPCSPCLRVSLLILSFFFLIFSFFSCSKQTARIRPVIVYDTGIIADDEGPVLENEYLHLRFLPHTAEIILTDKASGAQWRSNPPPGDEKADVVTTYLMESQFSLEYADTAGVGMTLYSHGNSVSLGNYSYAVTGDGLEVRYTVGDIARSYIIPPAALESRMRSFLDKMEGDDRRKIEASYRLYDINNLRSSDDRNTLLANYPDLSRTKVYVLRENTQDFMREMMEGYFADSGYTSEDYYEDISRYPSTSGADKPAFNITFLYTLDGRSLVLSVPFDKIAWRPSYPITKLNLMPFMGSGNVDDEGYLVVPDGSGALIYFNNGKQNQIAYNINVYGWDEAMPRDAVISDNKAPFPVFGIQKNGAALLCVIEEGAAYAGVHADVSGRNCSQNSVYAHFDMIHGAKMDISGRSDRPVYLYEKDLPSGEGVTLRYTPCVTGGYVSMAKEYRAWLMNKFPALAARKRSENGVPVVVEIVGAVNKTRHRMGLPSDLPLRLTSYRETESMVRDFAGLGWRNVRIKLNGWFNRSVEHSVPTKLKLIGELGGKKDFRELTAAVEKNGYDLFPEADFLYIKDKKPFDGFSLYRDAARYVNRKRIEKYPFSFVWFGERTQWGKLSYLARPASMMSMIDGFVRQGERFALRNFAFRSMGSKLSGDYNEKRAISREAAMKMRQEKLARLNESGTGILLNGGFAYAVPWASVITDMALDDQSFGITDVSVPFYQIALHGLVPYTGRAINLAEDYAKNLLKTIESGAGLYFSFMIEETAVLQETKFRQFYANEYDKWIGDADVLYRQFSADFAGLYSQAIVDHAILSPGVTLTEYEDGTRIIVNFNDNNYIVLRQGEY